MRCTLHVVQALEASLLEDRLQEEAAYVEMLEQQEVQGAVEAYLSHSSAGAQQAQQQPGAVGGVHGKVNVGEGTSCGCSVYQQTLTLSTRSTNFAVRSLCRRSQHLSMRKTLGAKHMHKTGDCMLLGSHVLQRIQ